MSKNEKPIIAIYDMETDTTIEREMTDIEFAQHEIDQIEWLKIKNYAEEKLAAKQAIAERLGLTADELKVLLG